MYNPIDEKRRFVQSQIQKSFDSGINVAEEMSLEKAHKDGDHHPTKPWVWVSSANGGKGDWRVEGGRAHKKAGASTTDAHNGNNSNANNAGFKKHYDKDSNETWYEGQVNGKRVRVLQETVGKTDWWNVEVDGKYIKDSNGRAMTFQTPKDALDEINDTVGTMSSSNEKTWDKLDDFNKKGSDENNLWNSWYKYQKSGDPSHISTFRNILEKKFPKVAEWKQTSPNTGKAVITAKDSDGNDIASIDLSGDKIILSKLQTFMDKCYDISKKDAGTTGNSIDSVWDDKAGGYKTEPFKGAAKVDSLKAGDKLQTKSGKIYTIKSLNNNANNTVEIVMDNGSKIGGGVFAQTYNKSGYMGATKVDDKKNTTSKTKSPQDKVKNIMQQFDDTTMDEDEFDEYVDSVLGNNMGQKLRKQILESNKSFSDKRQAYEDAVERHLGLKPQYSGMDAVKNKRYNLNPDGTPMDMSKIEDDNLKFSIALVKTNIRDLKNKLSQTSKTALVARKKLNAQIEDQEGKLSEMEEEMNKRNSKSDPRDKIAQDAGFKDYEEMKGYQDYTTMKNLLKKPSTKAGMRLLYQQEVTKYEKDHANLIKKLSAK